MAYISDFCPPRLTIRSVCRWRDELHWVIDVAHRDETKTSQTSVAELRINFYILLKQEQPFPGTVVVLLVYGQKVGGNKLII